MKKKRLLALGMAILMGGMAITQPIMQIYALEQATGTNNIGNYWVGGPAAYYGNDHRNYLYMLAVDGKAAVCLDPVKRLHRGDTGNTTTYYFDPWTSPTNLTRDEGLFLAYAYIMAGGGNGAPMQFGPYYILAQMLCWRIESGPFSIDDFDEWIETTRPIIANHITTSGNLRAQTLAALDNYAKEVKRQMQTEAVASFMSKWPSEAPILELDYNEEKGIYEKDFELIDFLDATAAGYDQVWMQYFLDYETAIKQLEAEGKIDPGTLKMEHMADGGRNWLHVEYSGDIEKLKSCGPIPLHFEEGTDGAKYTYSPTSLEIWDPTRSDVQHMFMGVNYTEWTVYINFGGQTTPTPEVGEAKVNFEIFSHNEDWDTNYNVQLDKYDYETGETLEGSVFELYERFDDKDEINRENDGAVELYEGGNEKWDS